MRRVDFDTARHETVTAESGALFKTWRHCITCRQDAGGGAVYRDALELDAGRLIPLLWPFAYGFYRCRQARWQSLARTVLAGRG